MTALHTAPLRVQDEPATRPAVQRTMWADVAKGVCIVLVVLWHVIMKHYLEIDWRLGLPLPGAWGTLGEQLLPLRMPVFFTISGMFAVAAVNRPWRVLGRSKVAKFLYLYALWLLIHTTLLALVPDFNTDRATGPLALLEQLTITPSNLWYLYALALYFTIAKATRNLPRTLVLGAAFALSAITATGMLPTPGNRAGLFQNLAFFLVGLYFRPEIERLAAAASWRRLAITGGAFGAVMAVIGVLGAKTWLGVWPLASVLAMVFGVTAAAMACQWTAGTKVLTSIGRRTLPIYVMHMPLLALLHRVLVGPLSDAGTGWQYAVALLEPIVLTALLVGACLVLHRLLVRRAAWLFEMPALRADRRTPDPVRV